MRRLLLVRHGESLWNAEGRIQGQRCAGLSPTGRQQAQALATSLARAHPGARLATSDLQRAIETMVPLAAAVDDAPVREPRLRERSFGAWEGRLRAEVAAQDADRWRRWRDRQEVLREIGGESAPDLVARVVPLFEELLASTPPDGVTIAVTHGGCIWHGTHGLLGLPPGALGSVDNASITELAAFDDVAEPDRGARLVLNRWNQVTHLPPELRTVWRARARVSVPADEGRTTGLAGR